MNVLFQNKQWKVLSDFTILSENPYYDITLNELLNPNINWLSHLEQKTWVKLNLFQEAYQFIIENKNTL
jgi:hypothetical protein